MPVSTLKVEDLSASYGGTQAVDSISFEVGRGDILGIVGPNGAGKTTLFRAILGLGSYEGRISICGQSGDARLALLPLIGYVPQRISFERSFPATVRDIVSMGILPHRRLKECEDIASQTGYEPTHRYCKIDERADKVDAALDVVNMTHLADRRIGEISGGEAQRAFIAKSLVNDPLLLILDEPVTSVDASTQDLFYKVITRLNSEFGITIVWSSHDLDAISHIATRVACMDCKLFFHGDKDAFFADEDALRKYKESAMQSHMHGHEGEP